MTENYKIIGRFIKDMSSETPDSPTYIFVRDKISKYKLNIDINSRAIKNGIIEVNTILKFSLTGFGAIFVFWNSFSNCGGIFPSKPVFLPSIPLRRRKIKPAIIAKRIISIYSKL